MSHRPTLFWFRIEAALAILSSLATVLVLWRPDWIEALIGSDPDKHSGSLEWAIALGLSAVTVTLAYAAWGQWSRARHAAHDSPG